MDDDARITALRAAAHPVRLRMLSLLTGTAMSAAEVARALDLTHANASYHLRRLLDAGEIEEAGEERIRGGRARRYRYPHERHARAVEPGRAADRPTDAEQSLYVRAVAAELERRLATRPPGAPQESQHADLEGWVAPEVWDRARALVEEAVLLLHDANEPPGTPGTVHLSATTWLFRMPEQP